MKGDTHNAFSKSSKEDLRAIVRLLADDELGSDGKGMKILCTRNMIKLLMQ